MHKSLLNADSLDSRITFPKDIFTGGQKHLSTAGRKVLVRGASPWNGGYYTSQKWEEGRNGKLKAGDF